VSFMIIFLLWQEFTGWRWSFAFFGNPHLWAMPFAFVGAPPCG